MQPLDPRLSTLRDSLVGQVLRGSAGVSYYLRDRIGEGGQGWVFKANWEEPGGLVVIVKVLRPDAIHGESLPRFQREAEVLRLLSQQARPNPYIVRFYDHAVAEIVSGPHNERTSLPFTVLEYVHGPTLEQVLGATRKKGMPTERARRLLRQVVHALELVHSQQVVHRDLKPSNILIASEAGSEIAKVTDFGIVKRVDMNLQRTTTLAGASLGYAPPEQYEQGNQRVTPKTDIFSLAAIAFEMLSGELAFPFSLRENPLLIVTRILNGPRPELARVEAQLAPELRERPDIVALLDTQLRRALSPDPNDRHASVTEFWSAMEPLLRACVSEGERPSQLPFMDTDLSRTRQSGPDGDHTTQVSGTPAAFTPVRVNPHVVSTPTRSSEPVRLSANPSSWTWRVTTRPIKDGLVQSASFSENGELAVGAGPTGLARWENGAWAGLALPNTIDVRAVRGLRVIAGGDLLLFGIRGFAARLAQRGGFEVWTIPDREVNFIAAHIERGDSTTLVGERPLRKSPSGSGETIGAVAQVLGGRVGFVVDAPASTRLSGVTRLVRGPLVACGDWGTLVRIDQGVAEHVGSVCRGHLTAIHPLPDGSAVTVGAGGHALHISPSLDAQLEAVQTTRDLVTLAIGSDGVAWAGAAQARLLRRTSESWVRMSGDVGITSTIVAIWANDRLARAVCDDGAVIEGRVA